MRSSRHSLRASESALGSLTIGDVPVGMRVGGVIGAGTRGLLGVTNRTSSGAMRGAGVIAVPGNGGIWVAEPTANALGVVGVAGARGMIGTPRVGVTVTFAPSSVALGSFRATD